MHLASSRPSACLSSSYPKRRQLCNPYSLPYILRKLRINRGLTMGALASKFGLSEQYVASIESGARFPSLRYCLLCAKEFSWNPEWVKSKYANAAVDRFSERLKKRLCL